MPEMLSERAKTELDSFKVPPIFGSARNALYTRYTPNDWNASNQTNYMTSDTVRNSAERIRLDTARLCHEVNDKTNRTQNDVGRRLGDRIGDIDYWKTEIHNETDKMLTEIEALNRAKGCLEKMLSDTDGPLHVSQECLYAREKRQGIDLVHDDVERALIREVDTIKRCQDEMRKLIQKSNDQLSLDRAAQHDLERDSGDKASALNIDNTCHQLNNSSRGIQYYDGIHRVDNTVSVPETWARFSDNNIRRSQSERSASRDIRNLIDQLMSSVSTTLMNEWNSVNTALADRVAEYTNARNGVQTHLAKVLQEIFDMEKNIALIKLCIQEKEAPMQVAQTRLATRTHRPNVEACRDPVQHRLVEEVYEIGESLEQLRAKLREAENALQHLLRTKMSLDHDLGVKNTSFFIDRETCLGMRKTFPMLSRVACY
jgi:tektin-3